MTAAASAAATPAALSGIRVVEFGPYVALPLTGRILGSLGAEVIKVETNKVLDEMAFIPAWSRGAGQPEYQRAKRRITLDVRTDAGRDLMLQLARISDVFMTNFRRNVLHRWGIDFPAIRRQRPDAVIMWQTGLGGHGPYYTYKSFGILVQHLSGVSMMTGLPDEPPGVVNTSYSDYHTGVFQPAGIIAALMRRRLTGKTATLESSIFKSGVATCGPALLDYQANAGRSPQRRGNRDAWAVPHNVYPCAGTDRYLAISVSDDDQWQRLRQAMGSPDWAAAPEYQTRIARRRHEDALDAAIAQWTRPQDAAVHSGIRYNPSIAVPGDKPQFPTMPGNPRRGGVTLMSGRRKFSELTSKFTAADWRIIEAKKAELRADMQLRPADAAPATDDAWPPPGRRLATFGRSR